MTDPFGDIMAANAGYATGFALAGLRPEAARGLGVVTCIDSRIEPLTMLGLVPGDAKILRNAGARVTDDALRSLVVAVHFLDVERIAVIAHTRCAMAGTSDEVLRTRIAEITGEPVDGWEFHAVEDQLGTLAGDVARLRNCPLIPDRVSIGGFVYDVDSGAIHLEMLA